MKIFRDGPEEEAGKQRARTAMKMKVDVLNEGTMVSAELWSILSAFRGPDALSSHGVKTATTCNVRGAVGLNDYGVPNAVIGDDPVKLDAELMDRGEKVAGTHFAMHYQNAVYALQYFGFVDEDGKRKE